MSDPNTFNAGFEAGQQIGDMLRQGGPNPALTAIYIGLLKGLQNGLQAAEDLLQEKLEFDLQELKLEREHQAKRADYSRRLEFGHGEDA